MEIDTRFPPPPKKVRVPLYPNNGRLPGPGIRNAEKKMAELIADTLHAPADRVVLARSASYALYAYLTAGQSAKMPQRAIKVAMPAYNCPDIIDAVIASGCEPVFIDLDDNLQIPADAVDFAAREGCRYILWPNYFGTRVRDEEILKKCNRQGLKIIFDEAQPFPIGYDDIREQVEKYAEVVLISFGCSKAIAGRGGGGMYIPSGHVFHSAREITQGKIPQTFLQAHSAVRQKIRWAAPNLAAKLFSTPRLFNRLDELQERLPAKTFDSNPSITHQQAQAAYRNFLRILKNKTHLKDFTELRQSLEAVSADSTRYISKISDFPAIVALAVRPEERYDLMAKMSVAGVQVTWYYYPLHLITRFRSYKRQKMTNTERIASSVMIVPFGWSHTASHKRSVKRILQKSLANVRKGKKL